MNGKPYEALKIGASDIVENILDENQPFERFITIYYDDEVSEFESKDKKEYLNKIKMTKCRGKTNFVNVFEQLSNIMIIDGKDTFKELTIIFFTDGCDTCNKAEQI